jgi:hypothetical protein
MNTIDYKNGGLNWVSILTPSEIALLEELGIMTDADSIKDFAEEKYGADLEHERVNGVCYGLDKIEVTYHLLWGRNSIIIESISIDTN